ncbi:splicing regulator RBM11 [Melospiza georgiana]|uniref:splicing regulator RBM11 n=1 Tax=Melospiza georgiana TaxID=44398 RepID=UPI0025AD7D0C|nr:splicing regulator RBM11 [Melospiza georgiana]
MSSLVGAEAAEQTLLVGNLESRVREEILYELFLQAGPLTKVMICEDKEGKPQSFGYVCFKHKVSVPYAKALLDGICLYGRPITVRYWRGNSPSPQLDSCTDGFEHHIDLESPADRHEELSGNHPFPLTPLPVNNSLLHDHPGFQEVVMMHAKLSSLKFPLNNKTTEVSISLNVPCSGIAVYSTESNGLTISLLAVPSYLSFSPYQNQTAQFKTARSYPEFATFK